MGNSNTSDTALTADGNNARAEEVKLTGSVDRVKCGIWCNCGNKEVRNIECSSGRHAFYLLSIHFLQNQAPGFLIPVDCTKL